MKQSPMQDISLLLVQDDSQLGKTIQEELTLHGFPTDLAFDGKIVESLFSNNTNQLVLLDINLPYENGWEF